MRNSGSRTLFGLFGGVFMIIVASVISVLAFLLKIWLIASIVLSSFKAATSNCDQVWEVDRSPLYSTWFCPTKEK